MDLQNSEFQHFEIRSEYPLRVMAGPCQSTYTVDLICDSGPADIVVVDLRRAPIFAEPRSNTVTVTGHTN